MTLSYRTRGGLGVRMEQADAQSAAENQDPEQSLAIDQDAAAEVGEADMVGEQAEELHSDIDASTAAAEELATDVLPAMAEAAADDGFTPREAEQVQARLERIAQMAGIDFASTGLVMRRENFGSAASRKSQTNMRMEAAAGMLGKIWENIKKAWAWLKDQLGGIWSKWTGNAEGIKKRLNDIQGRITSLPAGAKAKDNRLKTQARFFSIDRNTTAETIGKVVESVKGMDGAASELRKILTQTDISDLKADMNAEQQAEIGANFSKYLVEALTTNLKSNRDRSKLARSFQASSDNTEVTDVIGALPSGRALVVENSTVTSGSKSVNIAKVSLAVVEDSFAEDYEAPKDKAALNALTSQGLDVINVLIKSTKTKAEVEEAIKQVMNTCDSLAKQATSFAESDKNADQDDLRNSVTVRVGIMRSMQTVAKALTTQTPKMLFDTAAALADIAAAGVSNMKEDKK